MTIELLNKDFRDFLAEAPSDLLNEVTCITDPPYNIAFRYNTYKDDLSEDEYIEMLGALKGMKAAVIHYPIPTVESVVPALGTPNDMLFWCYPSNLPHQTRIISIYETKADRNAVKQPYRNPKDKRIQALIESGSEGARMYDWFDDIAPVKNVSKEKGIHPCPVPVALMERIILMTTHPGDTVFDPFMGSGTTAIAAIKTSRNFVGCEIDPVYFREAESRIRAQLLSVYDKPGLMSVS